MDQQEASILTEHKNPDSNFQKMVSIIKYNALKALEELSERAENAEQ